jgi:hypothetical protein
LGRLSLGFFNRACAFVQALCRGNALVTRSLHSPGFPSCGNKIAAIHPFSRTLSVKGGNQKARFLVALSEV